GHPKLGLWYQKALPFDLVAYSDSDYGGASQDRKSTTEGSQFWGRRSSSKLSRDQTSNPTSSTNPTSKGRIRRSSKQKVENSNFEENPLPPEVPMAENQTMAQLLQAPTEGACPHHGFSELHQLDTFYNALNVNDQDSLNSAAGGNFLDKMPADCLKIIESKSKVRQTRAKAVVAKVNSSSSTLAISSDVAELKDMVRALLLDKKNQSSAPSPTPAPVKAVEPNCVNRGGTHSYQNCPTTSGNVYQDNIQEYVSQAATAKETPVSNLRWLQIKFDLLDFLQFKIIKTISIRGIILIKTEVGQSTQNQCQTMQNQFQTMQNQLANLTEMISKFMSSNTASSSGSGTLPGNTITNPKEDLKGITTQGGVAYQGPTIPNPSKVAKQGTEVTKDQVQTPNSQSTTPVQPTVIQSESKTPVSEPVVAPVSVPMPNLKPSIPYPSRHDNERRRDQANEQIEKFYEIFKDMSFEISFMDALILMPKFASTLKALIGNKEKLSEMARTPMNEHCSTVILNKLPRKHGDPGKFLIPYRSVSKQIGIAKDVSVKVGVFHFPADFVVVDFEPDPPSLLNSQEVFLKDHPTPSDDLIVSTTSPMLTSFGDSDFLLFEEADAFLGLEDDLDSPELDPSYYDPEGDIFLLEAILNSDPSPPLPNHEQSVPSFKHELKACEAKTIKSFIDEPPEVELKDLPPHLEYAFLEGDNKLPVIISKELGEEEISALIKVLKSHKRAIAWKLSDIQGINPEFCTHKILMEEDYKPAIQHQRRVNPKIHDVIKKGGFTVVKNEENELIPTRLVTEWNEYYCFLDGFSGYFQISIDPCDQEKTTFTCPYGTFAYRRTMEVFMDDLSVFGNSFENCLSRLDKMLQRCEDTKYVLIGRRATLWSKRALSSAIRFIKKRLRSTKPKLMSLLNYLIPPLSKDFAKISLPMTHLLEKDTPFVFSEDCIQAFQTLKKKLTEAPILIAPNWDLPFELMCNASDFAIGAVLGQRHEKHFRPIHYASKTMTDAESNYTTTEKEMLAIVASWFADFANHHAGNFIVKGGHHGANLTAKKVFDAGLFWPTIYKDAHEASTLWARSCLHEGTNIFSWPLIICRNRFSAPRAIISDRGTHFCNDQFKKVIRKYGVTHRLSTAYYPQTSGQVEVTNRGLKRILERTIELARMRYEKPPPKLTFYKAFFSAQWKFLIHTIVQCMSAKRTDWNEFSSSMASLSSALPQEQPTQPTHTYKTSMTLINTLMETCATMTQKVAHLGQDKVAQALEITKLKQRVKRLERKRRSKHSGLKRLKKVGTSQRVKSSNDTVMDAQEDASKQEGGIAKLDADEDVTLVDVDTSVEMDVDIQGRLEEKDEVNDAAKEVSVAKPTVFDDEEVTMTMAQTLIKMKAKKARILDEQMAKRLHDKEVEADARKHLDNIMKYQNLKRKPISVRPIFEREYNKVQTFLKPDKDEEPAKKRGAKETLLQESFKKLRAEVEASGSHTTQQDTPTVDPTEISEEDVQNMLQIVLMAEFKVEALQVKERLSFVKSSHALDAEFKALKIDGYAVLNEVNTAYMGSLIVYLGWIRHMWIEAYAVLGIEYARFLVKSRC
nr:reverse transcriptase domain-containing protein [Tanacetum cinerariifolium]